MDNPAKVENTPLNYMQDAWETTVKYFVNQTKCIQMGNKFMNI